MVECLEYRLAPSVNVLTYHNDGFNDGQNLNETVLTPANVNSTDFGKQFSVALDGAEVGQPLYMSGLNITTGPLPGIQNVVFVATTKDSVYAINADNGTLLWQTRPAC
jgi:outer membrane protein assembly factor BamB